MKQAVLLTLIGLCSTVLLGEQPEHPSLKIRVNDSILSRSGVANAKMADAVLTVANYLTELRQKGSQELAAQELAEKFQIDPGQALLALKAGQAVQGDDLAMVTNNMAKRLKQLDEGVVRLLLPTFAEALAKKFKRTTTEVLICIDIAGLPAAAHLWQVTTPDLLSPTLDAIVITALKRNLPLDKEIVQKIVAYDKSHVRQISWSANHESIPGAKEWFAENIAHWKMLEAPNDWLGVTRSNFVIAALERNSPLDKKILKEIIEFDPSQVAVIMVKESEMPAAKEWLAKNITNDDLKKIIDKLAFAEKIDWDALSTIILSHPTSLSIATMKHLLSKSYTMGGDVRNIRRFRTILYQAHPEVPRKWFAEPFDSVDIGMLLILILMLLIPIAIAAVICFLVFKVIVAVWRYFSK